MEWRVRECMKDSNVVHTAYAGVRMYIPILLHQNMYVISPQKPETYKELKNCWNWDIMSSSVNEESPVLESRNVTNITGVHHVLAVVEEDQLAESLKT